MQPKLKEARGKRGVNEIPDAEATELLTTVSNLRTKLSVPVALAMPLVQSILALNLEDKGQPESRMQHDKVAQKGPYADWFDLAHISVPIPKP